MPQRPGGDIGHVGHINLNESMDVMAERFIRLVEALDQAGVCQHVIVANERLARRVGVCDSVIVGAATSSAVMACCLMPRVELVHVHGEQAGPAGLLLTLTRSIPYVMTPDSDGGRNRIQRAVRRRAMGRLDIGDRLDIGHVQWTYSRAMGKWRSKTILV